ncbi:hypothetical protein Tco_0492760, partial [Tanacetum coccineum]
MAKLAFCDYHNMVDILEKTESNTDFYQIVNFLEASYLRRRTVTESSIRRHLKLLDDEDQTTSPEPIQQATTLPSQSHPDISIPRRLIRGAIRISQSKAPIPRADETASPTRDDRHREAFPTATSLDAGQDMENIAKTSVMPYEASPGVTCLSGGEGKKSRICSRGCSKHRRVDQGEDLMTIDVEKSTGKGSDNTDEAANVLSTLEAVNVLSSGSLPTAAAAGVATASGSFPTAAIFTTASITTPYKRRTRAL